MLKGINFLVMKELKDYFSSPLVYVLASLFSGIMGLIFYNYLISSNEITNLSIIDTILLPTFGAMNFLLMFIVPLLTMGQFSEEKKNQTLDLIMMSNLRPSAVIVGKFLSTFIVVFFLVALTFIFPIILGLSGFSDWGLIFTNYLAIYLSVMAYISVGLFASTLTENQIISVVVTFCILFALLLLVNMAQVTDNYIVGLIIQYFSIGFHHAHFSRGQLVSFNFIYYFSFVGFFFFLTHKSVEARRW